MEKSSLNHGFPGIRRIRQRTDYHCGPAVAVMMASHVGISLRQHDIVLAAGAEGTYRKRGMTVPEIATGVTSLAPEAVFAYKTESSIQDLDTLVNTLGFPVGVEWQGAFGQYADEDNGHYSMVTEVDRVENRIVLSDPFYYFAGTDRTFPMDEFMSRWWDVNEIPDVSGNAVVAVHDIRMLFVIARTGYRFPETLGLRTFIHAEVR